MFIVLRFFLSLDAMDPDVLLAFIEQTTSVIDSWTTATLLQQQLVYSVFQTLLFVPTDYLSRPLRNSLVKRAILLDQAITASSDVRLLRDLRVSIARMLLLTDHSENLVCRFYECGRLTLIFNPYSRLIFICISNIYIKTMVL